LIGPGIGPGLLGTYRLYFLNLVLVNVVIATGTTSAD
jgi:hypothetical protein